MLEVRRDETVGDRVFDLRLPADNDKASPQPTSTATSAPELHVRELAGLLLRGARLVISIPAVGTILATLVALLIPPKYTATAQLVVERPVSERRLGEAALGESIDTHVILITARDHLQRVVG